MTLLFELGAFFFPTGMFVPGAPSFNLYLPFFSLLAAYYFYHSFLVTGRINVSPTHIFILLFLLIVAFTAAFRGVGVKFFGGSLVGGAPYISIAVMAIAFFVITDLRLSERKWRKLLLLACAGSFVPFISDLLALIGGIDLSFVIGRSRILQNEIFSENTAAIRFTGLLNGSFFLFIGIIVYRTKPSLNQYSTDSHGIGLFVILAICIVVVLFSGHRIGVIQLVLTFFIYTLLEPRGKAQRLITIFSLSVICFILFAIFLPAMPEQVQRAFAWVPGTNISAAAKQSAADSSEWRLIVWQFAFEEMSKYLVIGKGFAYPASVLADLEALKEGLGDAFANQQGRYLWAVATGNYHNGPIELLVIFGIGGIFFGLVFLILLLTRHYKTARRINLPTPLSRYYKIVVAAMSAKIIIFILIFGSLKGTLATILFFGLIAESMRKSLLTRPDNNTPTLDRINN